MNRARNARAASLNLVMYAIANGEYNHNSMVFSCGIWHLAAGAAHIRMMARETFFRKFIIPLDTRAQPSLHIYDMQRSKRMQRSCMHRQGWKNGIYMYVISSFLLLFWNGEMHRVVRIYYSFILAICYSWRRKFSQFVAMCGTPIKTHSRTHHHTQGIN